MVFLGIYEDRPLLMLFVFLFKTGNIFIVSFLQSLGVDPIVWSVRLVIACTPSFKAVPEKIGDLQIIDFRHFHPLIMTLNSFEF